MDGCQPTESADMQPLRRLRVGGGDRLEPEREGRGGMRAGEAAPRAASLRRRPGARRSTPSLSSLGYRPCRAPTNDAFVGGGGRECL